MTPPPLPATPCVRVRLDYSQTDGFSGGSRFFLSYSGSAPTGANCSTLASDIATQWATDFPSWINVDWALTEVDVLDIASDSGLSGQWSGSHPGTRSGGALPAQVAGVCEFGIARRYRGGKPRMFLPPGVISDLADPGHWISGYLAGLSAAPAALMAGIETLSIGAMGTLAHVNLSYYKGFTNITNSSGRTRAVPSYRSSALVDTVTGYFGKARLGSQNRRRAATSY